MDREKLKKFLLVRGWRITFDKGKVTYFSKEYGQDLGGEVYCVDVTFKQEHVPTSVGEGNFGPEVALREFVLQGALPDGSSLTMTSSDLSPDIEENLKTLQVLLKGWSGIVKGSFNSTQTAQTT